MNKLKLIYIGIIAVMKKESKLAHFCAKQLKLDKILEYFKINDHRIHFLQNIFITDDYLRK